MYYISIRFVHRERIWQADLLMSALELEMLADEKLSFAEAVQKSLLHCPAGE